MSRKKKKVTRRNPVVREVIKNPNRNAGAHKRKQPSRRDEKRVEE